MAKIIKNKFLFLLIICVMFIGLTGCASKQENSGGTTTASGTNDSSNSNSQQNISESELEKNITSSGAVTELGKLVVFAKNGNKVAVDMEIEVEFYDANSTIIGSGFDELASVGADGEIAVEIWSTPESWDNYKIYIDVEQTNQISYYDQIELTHNDNGTEIAVQVKNNTQDTIEYITVAVVYYQGDKVVGIDDSIESDVKSGRNANFTLDYPHNKKYNTVKFDNYKVFINEAYSFNW